MKAGVSKIKIRGGEGVINVVILLFLDGVCHQSSSHKIK